MGFCDINKINQKGLLDAVAKDVANKRIAGEPYVVEDTMLMIYNKLVEGGSEKDRAITAAALVPRAVLVSMSIYPPNAVYLASVAGKIAELQGKTTDFNLVIDIMGLKESFAQRLKDAEATNYFKLHRREVKRGSSQITYGIDYIPMNRETTPSKKISSDREFIYDFKNGNYTTEHIRVLEKLLLPDLCVDLSSNLKFDKQWLILPIPASTKRKQHNRYYRFLIEFCQNKQNLINGFEFIQLLFDREAKHTSETRESKVNYKIDLTSISKLGNVDIIVFDDLVTQGSTISQFLNELGGHKNKVKQIITLGATV